jgi:hypothetical protein
MFGIEKNHFPFFFQPFQSTYRQRNDEFRKIFKDLPNDERLIVGESRYISIFSLNKNFV